jgi:hypothetical protein
VRQQRLAANFVQDLGKLRFQARAFSSGHDGDGDSGRCGWSRRNCGSGFLHFSNYTLCSNSSERW